MPVKVSVIVPVFNPGEGIRKCIQSLIGQTLRDIEIIFVDDCGTDNAMTYIKKAAQKDDRIKIQKNPKNMGAGQSRNIGINIATGEYLSFIDPDDYIFPDFLELLYEKAVETKADIIKGTMRNSRIVDCKETLSPATVWNVRIRKALKEGKALYSVFYLEHTTALYRRETVLNEKAYYGKSSNAEDIVFLLRICYGKRRIVFEDRAYYVYVEREGSNNRTASIRRLKGEIQSVKEMLFFLDQHDENTQEGYEYLSKFITKILEVQKVISKNPGLKYEAAEVEKEVREMLLHTRVISGLKTSNVIVEAFVDYALNLAVLPYMRYWYEGTYGEYKDQIKIWVDFLREHPGNTSGCQPTLWRVFEAAIVYDGWKNEKEFNKRAELSDIRRQAYRLPDKKILTDNYISMKLFIDYGINTFRLRDSSFGNLVKRMAVLVRGYKSA